MQTDVPDKNCILNAETVKRAIRRMAFQIAENNAEADSLLIAGVVGNGTVVAQKLKVEVEQILGIPVHYFLIDVDKKAPLDATVSTNINFNDQIIIVVDDVSNTGKTLLYALKPFLNFEPKKIQTVVLVERSHKLFAVQPDYVGLSVSTTLQEHILVRVEEEEISGAWLY